MAWAASNPGAMQSISGSVPTCLMRVSTITAMTPPASTPQMLSPPFQIWNARSQSSVNSW